MSIHSLTFKNFFTTHIIDPLSKELSRQDRIIALVTSIALGILFLGLIHLGVALATFIKKHTFTNEYPPPPLQPPSPGGLGRSFGPGKTFEYSM